MLYPCFSYPFFQMFALRLAKAVPRVVAFKPAVFNVQKRFGHALGYSHYLPKEEVESRIMTLLNSYEVIPKDKLTPTAHFQKDLGLDSLSVVELIFELEQEFEIDINDTDAAHIETVEEAIHYFSHMPFTQ